MTPSVEALLLDRFCAEIGRDPASITRSIVLPVSYDHPGSTRDAIAEAIGAGFRHIVLGLPAPYPENAARWVTSELIDKSASGRACRTGVIQRPGRRGPPRPPSSGAGSAGQTARSAPRLRS